MCASEWKEVAITTISFVHASAMKMTRQLCSTSLTHIRIVNKGTPGEVMVMVIMMVMVMVMELVMLMKAKAKEPANEPLTSKMAHEYVMVASRKVRNISLLCQPTEKSGRREYTDKCHCSVKALIHKCTNACKYAVKLQRTAGLMLP